MIGSLLQILGTIKQFPQSLADGRGELRPTLWKTMLNRPRPACCPFSFNYILWGKGDNSQHSSEVLVSSFLRPAEVVSILDGIVSEFSVLKKIGHCHHLWSGTGNPKLRWLRIVRG